MGLMKSFVVATAGCIHIPDGRGGRQADPFFSGRYIVPHTKNGKFYPAHWVGTVFINDGNKKVGENGTTLTLSVWNGRHSKPGEGSADMFAKCVSVGQTLTMELEYRPYRRPIVINGQQIMRQDGSGPETVIVPAFDYIPRSRRSLVESPKLLEAAIARGQMYAAKGLAIPVADFRAMPDIRFTNPNHQAIWQQWQELKKARKALVYNGKKEYGYALCELPEGATYVPPGQIPQNLPTPVDSVHSDNLESRVAGAVGNQVFVPYQEQSLVGAGGMNSGSFPYETAGGGNDGNIVSGGYHSAL